MSEMMNRYIVGKSVCEGRCGEFWDDEILVLFVIFSLPFSLWRVMVTCLILSREMGCTEWA